MEDFVLARNPETDSSLPYLVRLPIEGGIFFKTRETWPRASRSYCHPIDSWPEHAEALEVVPIVFCENRKFAEEWTYRFLGTALQELVAPRTWRRSGNEAGVGLWSAAVRSR